MRLGIVLFSFPKYSETFFTNKFRTLSNLNIDYFVFAWGNKEKKLNYYTGIELKFANLMRIFFAFFHVCFVCPKRIIKLYRLNRSDNFSLKRNASSIFRSLHIINHNLDILHFGFATVAKDMENLATVMGCKLFVSVRGYDIAVFPLKHPGCYDLLWMRIDRLHYLSDNLLDKVYQTGLSMNIDVCKITPAVDLDNFSFKGNCNFGEILEITTVSRLHWIKGYSYTLKALSLFKSSGFKFKFNIIGDGPVLEEITFLINELYLEDCVILHSSIAHKSVVDILNRSDIYIQNSFHEGFCNAVLEAQAIGCICLVSDAGALSENVVDNVTGFVFEKLNPMALFEKLKYLVNLDQSIINSVRSNAIQRIKSNFDIKIQMEKYRKFYYN
jgi:colanic acid/amylovoran biosynthesis glycosyltransferase